MWESRYHPLIGADGEYAPLFPSRNEDTVRRAHRLYLAESVPRYYRLCSSQGTQGAEDCGYSVHCPRCGIVMRTVALPVNDHIRALYACNNCRIEKEK